MIVPTGKLELDIEPFSISDAVFKVKAALRGGLMQKRIQLVPIGYHSHSLLCAVRCMNMYVLQQVLYKSPLVPDQIMGDRYRIEHVIMNFVSNAIKFSPADAAIVVDVSVEGNTGSG